VRPADSPGSSPDGGAGLKYRLRTVTFIRDEATSDSGRAENSDRAVEICRSTLKTDREHGIVFTSQAGSGAQEALLVVTGLVSS
jgi:hypothetical protein